MKPKQKTLKLTDPVEAAVMDQIEVRLITPEEKTRWDELVTEPHYLKNAQRVGELLLRQVVEYRGEWVALLGWSAAAYHLQHRNTPICWAPNQRRARLRWVANHARYCVLAGRRHYPKSVSPGPRGPHQSVADSRPACAREPRRPRFAPPATHRLDDRRPHSRPEGLPLR